MLRILHLVGSPTDELMCELSRTYALDCLRATADPARYQFCLAYVTPDHRWRFPTDLSRTAISAAPSMALPEATAHIAALRVDVMVPQMFCLPGMTHYRALFDLLGVPYVGNTADVMALAADKAKTKAVVAAAGVAVPLGEVLRRGATPSLPPPAVVKPVAADNSVGVGLVRSDSEYQHALDNAFEHSERVLVENYIELGREVRCAVMVRDGRLDCLPLEEYNVNREHRPVRTYADKLSRGADGEVRLVAKDIAKAWIVDPGDPLTQRVWSAARRCHAALGCRDYSLFDFRVDSAGEPWFLEAGLYWSFAEQSVISVMARAAGHSLPDLFEAAICHALSRGAIPVSQDARPDQAVSGGVLAPRGEVGCVGKTSAAGTGRANR